MYEKLMRFKIIKDDRVFDAYLDERLSFVDNFRMLMHISDYEINDCMVYDPSKNIFLDNKMPIREFDINDFKIMYLF